MLDTNEQQMNLNIQDYILYRSTNADFSDYTAIATNAVYTDSYLDTNINANVVYYYELTFQSQDSPSGLIVESPRSDEVAATGQTVVPLIPYNAYWNVVTNLASPNDVTNMQAPFSCYITNAYPGIAQLPNNYWAKGTSMSNYINMVIPTNSVPLSQVTYSIAIDNDYALYLNNSNAPIQTFKHENYAIWVPYQSFDDVAPGLLHYGTNSLRVVITDEGDINYFSMIVSTNACGQ
jgi:hypothetical protein